ncbi:MAG: hypothetical protein LBM61_01090 [Prevotellaceae bacterium]|jgi:hypothetical protein|nr:hypothetical protein [Prevotellaceae bacterium]
MKLNHSSQKRIEDALRKVVDFYPPTDEPAVVTDIYFKPNPTLGELELLNDDEKRLACVIIDEWVNNDDDTFYEQVERDLREILHRSDVYRKLSILKPYSFVLVDEDKETLAELLMVDDDLVIVHNGLLQGLDKELDDFMRHLLDD